MLLHWPLAVSIFLVLPRTSYVLRMHIVPRTRMLYVHTLQEYEVLVRGIQLPSSLLTRTGFIARGIWSLVETLTKISACSMQHVGWECL